MIYLSYQQAIPLLKITGELKMTKAKTFFIQNEPLTVDEMIDKALKEGAVFSTKQSKTPELEAHIYTFDDKSSLVHHNGILFYSTLDWSK